MPHHIGGVDKPDGCDPSACQTYREIDQFLAEPDEEQFFDAIKAYVVTCVVSCRVAKEGSQKLQGKLWCRDSTGAVSPGDVTKTPHVVTVVLV